MAYKPRIVIFGAGSQLSYTIDIIEKEGRYEIVGLIDSVEEIGSIKYGYAVIGRQENIKQLIIDYNIWGGIISVGDNYTRYLIYESIISNVLNFYFVNAIHPSCIIGNNVTMSHNVIAMAGCIFNPNVFIGNFTFFATGAQIEHDCVIGSFASISAGTVLGGFVKVNRFAALTLNCTVVDRIEIGENTVVGAGSVVLKSLPDNVLAYGNPCQIIRNRYLGERFLK